MPFRPCPARKNRARVPLQICATCRKCGDIVITLKYKIIVDDGKTLVHETTVESDSGLLGEFCENYWRTIEETGKPPQISIQRFQVYEEEGTPLPS